MVQNANICFVKDLMQSPGGFGCVSVMPEYAHAHCLMSLRAFFVGALALPGLSVPTV